MKKKLPIVVHFDRAKGASCDPVPKVDMRCAVYGKPAGDMTTSLTASPGDTIVCDGTNADDLREHRPGKAAGLAAGVRSPLAEAGLTKAEIRTASRELGLPTWDAPAAPCLSSRVQYGLSITPSRLKQVEKGEAYLRALGVTGDLRVRHLGGLARLEVEPSWIPWIEARRAAITAHLTALGFAQVEIDSRGYRRGSLLERSSP